MTVQNIYDKVRFLGRYTTNDATDAQLLVLINDAVTDLVKFVAGLRQDFLLKEGTAVNLVADQADYTLATDILQIKQLKLDLTGDGNFYVAYRKDLTEANDLINQVEVASAPKYITIDQTTSTEFQVRIQPTPLVAVTGGLTYWYILRPAALTAGANTPVIPEDLHPAIVQKVLQELKQRDGDSVGMRLAMREGEALLAQYKAQIGRRNIDGMDGFNAPVFEE